MNYKSALSLLVLLAGAGLIVAQAQSRGVLLLELQATMATTALVIIALQVSLPDAELRFGSPRKSVDEMIAEIEAKQRGSGQGHREEHR